MNNKQSGIRINKMGRSICVNIGFGLILFMLHCASVRATDLAISGMEFAALAGDKLQIQLEMNGPASAPKIFHTDNPARIALDFVGVKNALNKKMYPVNQGGASSIYIAEAADRLRVVVNLIESTPFETKVVGNKVLLTLNSRHNAIAPAQFKPAPERSSPPPAFKQSNNSAITTLMPEQAISGFDFKRGDNGEGRILVSLANPNTIVNTKEDSGKVVLSFVNTKLPANLSKRLDVSEFATPVKYIEAINSSRDTTVTVTLQNNLYDYSLFQSEGLLTVEFRPLTSAEKEAQQRARVKYIGERLSLNFQDIEIRSVIAILAEFTGQNVVAGDDVTGTITLKLDDVPWDEALDFIMMTKELGKYETGNVTLISPLDKIKSYKKKQQETEAVVEQLDPLVTEYIRINYAKAEDFRNLLYGRDTRPFGSCGVQKTSSSSSSSSSSSASSSGSSFGQGQVNQNQNQNQGTGINNTIGKDERFSLLSARGSAVVDARTNTLIVRETPKRLEDAKELIRQLDVPVRQVMIEARVVIAEDNFNKNLGVRFGVAKQADFGNGNTFAVGGTGTKGNGNLQPNKDGTIGTLNDSLVDLGAASIGATPPGALAMTLTKGADYVLNLELQALQAEGRSETLSNPRVMTMDRCTAVMTQGTQIPVTTPGSANTPATVTYIDATLELNATPQITPSGSVIMSLLVKKDTANRLFDLLNPAIDTNQIKTSVLVEDGETVVLGGVYQGIDSNTKNKIPFFADLPGIGFLFTNSAIENKKKELLIFITPKIVKDALESN